MPKAIPEGYEAAPTSATVSQGPVKVQRVERQPDYKGTAVWQGKVARFNEKGTAKITLSAEQIASIAATLAYEERDYVRFEFWVEEIAWGNAPAKTESPRVSAQES